MFRRPVLLATLLACGGCEAPPPVPPAPVVVETPPPPPRVTPERSFEVRSGRVLRDETIVGALGRIGVDALPSHELVSALEGVFDFRRSRPGDEFRVTLAGGQVDLFEYRRSHVEEYLVRREGERLLGSARAFEIEKRTAHLSATLESSVWEAIQATGEDPQLALALADVLAWDIDFYNDPRKGDAFQIVVEKFVHDGRLVRYGDVLAAGYDGELVGRKRVYRYPNPKTGNPEYYGEDGSAARRAFLKSPLKFANVTSRFGLRRHPVLKYVKAHQGVDFGAAVGTPVWAVGDGTVTQAGWAGACGKMITLRHANGLESIYCHLSRIGEGVSRGARVAQKHVIGFTGATGRVTGPHLHYAVKRGGSFVNPLALKFPPSDPLPADEVPRFREATAALASRLDAARVASAADPAVPNTLDAAPTSAAQ